MADNSHTLKEGEMFICPSCKYREPYFAENLCEECYEEEYGDEEVVDNEREKAIVASFLCGVVDSN